MKSFSEKLRKARESMDPSQAELAQKAGLSQRSITAYEMKIQSQEEIQ